MPLEDRLAQFRKADVYVVITEAFCAGRSSLDVLDQCLEAGVRLVQLREKSGGTQALLDKAKTFRKRTAKAGALLIIDDRVDIALACDADGVHLGQDDLPIMDARRIAPDLIVGASTHDLGEALAAQEAGAGYVNIGPIFDTQTKDVPSGAIGPEAIGVIAPQLHIPFTCMGGIKAHNIQQVLDHGAQIAAVVTAVTAADDVQAAARELIDAIQRGRR